MENKTIRVGINGMGRIGRAFFRLAQNNTEIEVVAVNDLGDIDNIVYLMKYDTAYGPAQFVVGVNESPTSQPPSHEATEGQGELRGASKKALIVNDKEITFLSEKDPTNLPWGAMNVDIVVESTGAFTTFEKAKAHIIAGAKKVVITAPVKDAPADETQSTILMGVNCDLLKEDKLTITSNASCTTNAGSPLIQILNEKIGIEKAVLNTVHGYTASQSIVDGPNKKDWKEGRAGAQNIIPTTTGAAIAVTKVIKELEGKFDGLSMRVPIVAGSIVDVTFVAKRDTTVEEVNNILKEAAVSEHWSGIFAVTEDPIVSSDVIGALYGSIADLGLTRVIGGNLVKVCAWYDNEMGYTATLIKHVLKMGQNIK